MKGKVLFGSLGLLCALYGCTVLSIIGTRALFNWFYLALGVLLMAIAVIWPRDRNKGRQFKKIFSVTAAALAAVFLLAEGYDMMTIAFLFSIQPVVNLVMLWILGKIFVQNFFRFSLDKLLKLWYNKISCRWGVGGTPREKARVAPRLNGMHFTNFRLAFKHSLNAYRFAYSPCEVFRFIDVGSGKCDCRAILKVNEIFVLLLSSCHF